MAVTYTGNLKLGLPTTGTEPGTWGNVVNDQITTLVDQSISGTVSLTSMTNADYTLYNTDGNLAPLNEARYMALLAPSSLTLTAARNIIVPSTSKTYIVKNATTGGFSVTVKTSAGTGVEVPNGRTMLLYCDGPNVFVAFDTINTVSQNGGQLAGLRNRVINGGMKIDQRNAGASQTFTSNSPPNVAYCVDRWFVGSSGTGTITGQQITVGAENRYRFTGGAGNIGVVFAQRIEAANCMDLAGKTATLSAKLSSSTLTSLTWTAYYANTANTFGTFASPTKTLIATGTFTISNTEAAYSTQIAIPAAATTGIEIYFTTAAALTSGTLTFGDVQFELGSVATTFEQRPIGMELALCQRYALSNPLISTFFGTGMLRTSGTNSYIMVPTPVPLRATPTSSLAATAYTVYSGDTSTALTSLTVNPPISNSFSLQAAHTSIGSVGAAAMLVASSSNGIWSAEL